MSTADRVAQRGRSLAYISYAQLAVNVAGMVVGVRRRHAYHWLFLHGNPDAVARECVLLGTGLSAPITMLVTQLIATRTLTRSPENVTAPKIVRSLGAAMVPGYLGESIVRERLRPSGFDSLESPIAVAGVVLAAAMAVLPGRG